VRALAPGAFPSLRLSLFCGEPLPESSARAWREAAPNGALENLYGPTEATIACLLEPCGEALAVTPGRAVIAIGRPFDGMHAAIVSPENHFLPAGETGELVLSGAQVSAGYWRDPALTAERYPTLRHPALGARVFYKTGDLALEAQDGRFHHLGRVDNQVKIQGHRVELEEVDAQLRSLCGDEAAAVAWPIRDGSAEGIVAFVTAGARTPAEIRDGLKRVLPTYMLPRRIVALERLPLTLNGKIDRNALRASLEAGEAGGA
jgi:acyl-coenzyme A synthetase/AMP-(fatty) acid ligase